MTVRHHAKAAHKRASHPHHGTTVRHKAKALHAHKAKKTAVKKPKRMHTTRATYKG